MRFTKMQGVGNDFVVIDAAELAQGTDLPSLAIQLCDRRFGIGADGLLVVSRETVAAAFAMRMFNPDGTEDFCGNGLRCVGLWAHRAGWLDGNTEFCVATKEGLRRASIEDSATDGRSAALCVEMGLPRFAPADLPFCAPGMERIVGYPLQVADRTFDITTINTGSTHTVIFGAAPPDEATFQNYSPRIEMHPLFPARTTVLWATPRDKDTIDIRIWERGVGETWGCGTGACAVGVAAQVSQRGFPTALQVVSKGGTLWITWPGEGRPIQMCGPAAFVFDGEI